MWKIVIYYTYLSCNTCPESKQFSDLVTSLFARFICLVFVGLSGFFFFVLNLAKVQKEAYEKKEKEKAKQARTHVSCL